MRFKHSRSWRCGGVSTLAFAGGAPHIARARCAASPHRHGRRGGMAGTEGAAQEQPAAKVALDSVEDDDEFEEFECEGACARR